MAEYWSYNDYTLPRLPAGWDMQKYPYAIIVGVKTQFSFYLFCHNEPLVARDIDGGNRISFPVGTSIQSFAFSRVDGTDWESLGDRTPDLGGSNGQYYYYKDIAEWVWCTPDIKDESGNVVYAASVPVPIAPEEPEEPEEPETPAFDLRSWLTGYALGLCGKPLPFSTAQKEPVAYLYNGVRLPKLPEWDRVSYPYAVIAKLKDDYTFGLYDECLLFVSSQQPVWTGSIVFPAGTFKLYKYKSTETAEWVEQASDTDKNVNSFYNTVWCNKPILNEDGSIYLAASDPIPVYE